MKTAKTNLWPSLYRYNHQSCRYELTKPSAGKVLFYAGAVMVTSVFMLAGLLFTHDLLSASEAEKMYRKENAALQKNSAILTTQIDELENTLSTLQRKDNELHAKFFASVLLEDDSMRVRESKQRILLADAGTLGRFIVQVARQTEKALSGSAHAMPLSTAPVANNQPVAALPTLAPIEGFQPRWLLSGYGMRINPYHKGLYQHEGIDISVPRGTGVRNTGDGIVITVKTSALKAGYGNYIEVDHGNGFTSRYAHLEQILVRKGMKVSGGTIIGTSGNSGGSVAPHLHYEIIRNGRNVDPAPYILEGLTTTEYHNMLGAARNQNQSLD